MTNTHRQRRFFTALLIAAVLGGFGVYDQIAQTQQTQQQNKTVTQTQPQQAGKKSARNQLELLAVKGRAPKTGYARTQFGNGWRKTGSCDTRQLILARDLSQTKINDCKVLSGVLGDPYTGKTIHFARGSGTSTKVQIDHVVALSDAWQKGAQQLTAQKREILANDPLELLAVDGPANQQKSDGDAATWLPSNKSYRCRYVARQIAVKQKYNLWVTSAEKDAISNILASCPGQVLPVQKTKASGD